MSKVTWHDVVNTGIGRIVLEHEDGHEEGDVLQYTHRDSTHILQPNPPFLPFRIGVNSYNPSGLLYMGVDFRKAEPTHIP